MATSSFWLNFFKDAGIPGKEAKNYAVMFTEHRIKKDMLMDLNKEILNSLGVTLIGDVISIVRHAKEVHSESAREKVLEGDGSKLVSLKKVGFGVPESKTTTVKKPVEKNKKLALSDRLGGNNKTNTKTSISERLGRLVSDDPPKAVHLSNIEDDDFPLSTKIRKVPADEGAYTVIKPKGTTALTKKILSKEKIGDDSCISLCVHSSQSKKVAEPRVTITGLGDFSKGKVDALAGQSSVFGRLGTKGNKPQSSTKSDESEEGTLKSDKINVPVRTRLGVKPVIAPASSTTPSKRVRRTISGPSTTKSTITGIKKLSDKPSLVKKSAVKARLGSKKAGLTQAGVFSRLGIK
ncbi:DgyrCDS9778 [Dimorphilus gyrociliatus]|uniref:DgyrCDS9778 n=1 Tax=Dimorphilus gyrociliatus TaxID=2664684 RepID=A0A7I8VYC7_9ANNE|nr:DgyrCDS9778 [Dimorphilus gyrociliatus]